MIEEEEEEEEEVQERLTMRVEEEWKRSTFWEACNFVGFQCLRCSSLLVD